MNRTREKKWIIQKLLHLQDSKQPLDNKEKPEPTEEDDLRVIWSNSRRDYTLPMEIEFGSQSQIQTKSGFVRSQRCDVYILISLRLIGFNAQLYRGIFEYTKLQRLYRLSHTHMEITSENFEAQYNLIKDSINKAEFIAIDTEFSGHTASLDDKGHDYDTVEERYQKMKFTCQKFIAFQVGICTFHWDAVAKKYKCRPFSFYVFNKSKLHDSVMLFQSFYKLNNAFKSSHF